MKEKKYRVSIASFISEGDLDFRENDIPTLPKCIIHVSKLIPKDKIQNLEFDVVCFISTKIKEIICEKLGNKLDKTDSNIIEFFKNEYCKEYITIFKSYQKSFNINDNQMNFIVKFVDNFYEYNEENFLLIKTELDEIKANHLYLNTKGLPNAIMSLVKYGCSNKNVYLIEFKNYEKISKISTKNSIFKKNYEEEFYLNKNNETKDCLINRIKNEIESDAKENGKSIDKSWNLQNFLDLSERFNVYKEDPTLFKKTVEKSNFIALLRSFSYIETKHYLKEMKYFEINKNLVINDFNFNSFFDNLCNVEVLSNSMVDSSFEIGINPNKLSLEEIKQSSIFLANMYLKRGSTSLAFETLNKIFKNNNDLKTIRNFFSHRVMNDASVKELSKSMLKKDFSNANELFNYIIDSNNKKYLTLDEVNEKIISSINEKAENDNSKEKTVIKTSDNSAKTKCIIAYLGDHDPDFNESDGATLSLLKYLKIVKKIEIDKIVFIQTNKYAEKFREKSPSEFLEFEQKYKNINSNISIVFENYNDYLESKTNESFDLTKITPNYQLDEGFKIAKRIIKKYENCYLYINVSSGMLSLRCGLELIQYFNDNCEICSSKGSNCIKLEDNENNLSKNKSDDKAHSYKPIERVIQEIDGMTSNESFFAFEYAKMNKTLERNDSKNIYDLSVLTTIYQNLKRNSIKNVNMDDFQKYIDLLSSKDEAVYNLYYGQIDDKTKDLKICNISNLISQLRFLLEKNDYFGYVCQFQNIMQYINILLLKKYILLDNHEKEFESFEISEDENTIRLGTSKNLKISSSKFVEFSKSFILNKSEKINSYVFFQAIAGLIFGSTNKKYNNGKTIIEITDKESNTPILLDDISYLTKVWMLRGCVIHKNELNDIQKTFISKNFTIDQKKFINLCNNNFYVDGQIQEKIKILIDKSYQTLLFICDYLGLKVKIFDEKYEQLKEELNKLFIRE